MKRLIISIGILMFTMVAYGQNGTDASYDKGMQAFEQEQFGEAIRHLQHTLNGLNDKEGSQAGAVYLSLARVYLADRSMAESNDHYERARDLLKGTEEAGRLGDFELRLEYELEKEQDMAEQALASTELSPYREYLDSYKSGPNYEEVYASLDDLWFNKAKVEQDRVLMEEYLAYFPNGKNVKSANEEIYIMKNRPVLVEQYNQKAMEYQRKALPWALTFSAGAATAVVLPVFALMESKDKRKPMFIIAGVGAGLAAVTLYPMLKIGKKSMKWKRKAEAIAVNVSPSVDPGGKYYALSFNVRF